MNVEVTGFRGEVLTRLGRHPRNPGPYRGLKLYVTSGMLAESFCKDEPTSEARQLCVDRLVAPCDECMLTLASTGKSFLEVRHGRRKRSLLSNRVLNGLLFFFPQRSKICQRRLLARAETRLSAQTCGAEAAYATKQWIYSVRSKDVEGDLEP